MSAPAGCQLIGRCRIVETDPGHLGLDSHVILKPKRHPSSTAC
jgi:hypothetical protein